MPITHVKLGSVVTFNPRRKTRDYPVAAAPYVTRCGVDAATGAVNPVRDSASGVSAGFHWFQPGDLLADRDLGALSNGRVGQPDLSGGMAAGMRGVCTGGLTVIRPDPQVIDTRFLLHFLRSRDVRQLAGRGVTADRRRSSPSLAFLRELDFPLLPLAEQQRRAAALDAALDACAVRRREIGAIDGRMQARFTALFGTAETLPKRWTVKPLLQRLDEAVYGSTRWRQYEADSGALLIRFDNLAEGRVTPDNCARVRMPAAHAAHETRVRPGDVLIRTQRGVGHATMLPPDAGKAYIGNGVAILRSSRMEPIFLATYLASPAGLAEIARVSKPGPYQSLNRAVLCAIRVPLPPLAEQRRLLPTWRACDKDRTTGQLRLAQAVALCDATERAAFDPAHDDEQTGDGQTGDPRPGYMGRAARMQAGAHGRSPCVVEHAQP